MKMKIKIKRENEYEKITKSILPGLYMIICICVNIYVCLCDEESGGWGRPEARHCWK